MNRDLENPLNLQCKLGNFEGYQVLQHITLTHADVKATNTEENPNNVAPKNDGDASLTGGLLTTTLAPLSWNVIRLAKGRR